jgi:hypothetical protein
MGGSPSSESQPPENPYSDEVNSGWYDPRLSDELHDGLYGKKQNFAHMGGSPSSESQSAESPYSFEVERIRNHRKFDKGRSSDRQEHVRHLESLNLILENYEENIQNFLKECARLPRKIKLDREKKAVEERIQAVEAKIQTIDDEIDNRYPFPPTPEELLYDELLHDLATMVKRRVLSGWVDKCADFVKTPEITQDLVSVRYKDGGLVVEEFTIDNVTWAKKPNTDNRYALKMFDNTDTKYTLHGRSDEDAQEFLYHSDKPPPEELDLSIVTTSQQKNEVAKQLAILQCEKKCSAVPMRLLAVIDDWYVVYVTSADYVEVSLKKIIDKTQPNSRPFTASAALDIVADIKDQIVCFLTPLNETDYSLVADLINAENIFRHEGNYRIGPVLQDDDGANSCSATFGDDYNKCIFWALGILFVELFSTETEKKRFVAGYNSANKKFKPTVADIDSLLETWNTSDSPFDWRLIKKIFFSDQHPTTEFLFSSETFKNQTGAQSASPKTPGVSPVVRRRNEYARTRSPRRT